MDQNAYLKALDAKRPEDSLGWLPSNHGPSSEGRVCAFCGQGSSTEKAARPRFCNQAPTESWKAACAFEVSDMAGLTGKAADQACQLAGGSIRVHYPYRLQREESNDLNTPIRRAKKRT